MSRQPWIKLLAYCTGALVLALLAFAHVRFYSSRSQLPASGEITETIPGLDTEAEVVLDTRGVPHIRAATEHDVWFLQGYVHARDRFFQMDLARRSAEGRLCEVFGAPAFNLDRKARTWRLAEIAQRQATQLDDTERSILEAYTAGVNAALDQFGRWISSEAWLMMRNPTAWRLEDSLAIGTLLQLELTWAMGEELTRSVQIARLGQQQALELWGWTPRQARGWIPPIEQTSLPRSEDEPITPPFNGVGSNSWAISGSRTSTGRPLLANDPHIRVSLPGIWYVVDLAGPEVHVAGASVPGIPGVAIGHTEDVAWGLTMVMLDDQDLFKLTLDPSGAFETIDGALQPLRTVTERIEIRTEPEPRLLKVELSERGPVLRDSKRETLALTWSAQTGPSPIRAFLRMDRAESVHDLSAAWQDVYSPALNLIAADTGGQILHQVVGRIPDRIRGAGRLPSPGESSRWAWQGFLPLAINPRVVDPEQGFVATANHDMFTEGDYPESQRFPAEFAPPWRIRRIKRSLETRDDWDVGACLELQSDVVSLEARAALTILRPFLQKHGGPTAAALLDWDGTMDAELVAPLLYSRLMAELVRGAGQDEAMRKGLEESPFTNTELLQLLAGGLDEAWWDDVRTQPIEDRATIVARSLKRVDQMQVRQRWGEVHTVRFEHPLAALPVLGGTLGRLWSRGPLPAPGDAETISAHRTHRRTPGEVIVMPSMRFIADVGSWDSTVLMLPLGQSGRPWSRHYADQIAPWRLRQPSTLAFSEEAIARAAEARIRALPAQQ